MNVKAILTLEQKMSEHPCYGGYLFIFFQSFIIGENEFLGFSHFTQTTNMELLFCVLCKIKCTYKLISEQTNEMKQTNSITKGKGCKHPSATQSFTPFFLSNFILFVSISGVHLETEDLGLRSN